MNSGVLFFEIDYRLFLSVSMFEENLDSYRGFLSPMVFVYGFYNCLFWAIGFMQLLNDSNFGFYLFFQQLGL